MTQSLTPPRSDAAAATRAQLLAAECRCRVFLPGTPGYAAGRVPWNVAVDQHPAAVARPRDTDEVVELVRSATRRGLRLAPQGTGHGAGPLSGRDLSDVVLVRMDGWRGVNVDAERRTARVQAGAVWLDVADAAAPHGLAPLHGSSPDVGVAGYTLGGGLGPYARLHGLACNALVAVELVTADGRIVRASAEEDEDLFWALRGGGGNFGIVTALELRLFEIPDVVSGMLLWDISAADAVLRRWVAWCADAPDAATTGLALMQFPPLPQLPPFLRGRRVVVIDGAIVADDAAADALLAPLRDLAPEVDTFARLPVPEVLRNSMDPPEPTAATGGHAVLASVQDATVDAFLEAFGPGRPTSLLLAELRQLGGAVGRREPGAGALASVDGEFSMLCLGVTATPEMRAAVEADVARGIAALAPWRAAGQYLNFVETEGEAHTGFAAESWRRLTQLRRRFDPTELFVANQRIEPAAEASG